ncbi:MAG TPA: PH domain-containing protein [Rhizomicrobium sp.]|nr:PH domain-containing protein [Rhizomicrobium sp.]
MSYIQRSLGQGEKIVATAHFHWWYSFKAWLALIFLGIVVVGIWIFFSMMIRKWTTEIAVTSHRFVEKRGLFSLKTNEIALPNIEGVRVEQNLWGRILGYGHLRIEGTGVDAVEIPDIRDPIGFRRAIETAKFSGDAAPAKA